MTRTFLISIFALLFILSCESGSNSKPYLREPKNIFVVDNVVSCNETDAPSYVLFVLDTGRDFLGRIKLINGCLGTAVSDFTDNKSPGESGLLVGRDANGLAVLSTKSGYSVATGAFDGQKQELLIKKISKTFEYIGDSSLENHDIRTPLDFIVSDILILDGNYLITGYSIKLSKAITALYTSEGKKLLEKEQNIEINKPACSGNICFATEKNGNGLYSFTNSLEISKFVLPEKYSTSGNIKNVWTLSDNRFLVSLEKVLLLINDNIVINSIDIPGQISVLSASSVKYKTSSDFKLITQEKFLEKVEVSLNQPDLNFASDSDIETDDSDIPVNQDSDIPNPDNGTDSDTSDTLLLDAEKSDVLWLTLSDGRVISYDLEHNGWMIKPSSYETPSVEKIEYPTADNKIKIEYLKVIRGLFFYQTYIASYESYLANSSSKTGVVGFNGELFSDEFAVFSDLSIDFMTDKLLVFPNKNGCEPQILTITEIASSTILGIAPDENFLKNISCFEGFVKYAIYPADNYLVERIDQFLNHHETRAGEIALDKSYPIYNDDFVEFSIKRYSENKTPAGTSFRFSIKPGFTFKGWVSESYISEMIPVVNGGVILFVPTRSRIYEFDPANESVNHTFQ